MTKRHNVRVESQTPPPGASSASPSLPRFSTAPDGAHPTRVPTESALPTNPARRPAHSIFQ